MDMLIAYRIRGRGAKCGKESLNAEHAETAEENRENVVLCPNRES
jgi:hypothetical protein